MTQKDYQVLAKMLIRHCKKAQFNDYSILPYDETITPVYIHGKPVYNREEITLKANEIEPMSGDNPTDSPDVLFIFDGAAGYFYDNLDVEDALLGELEKKFVTEAWFERIDVVSMFFLNVRLKQ